jgi:hypothetical protein
LAELQGLIDTKIARVIARAPAEWVADQFGSYLPAKGEEMGSTPQSFADTTFCFNCGLPGHGEDQCNEPTFDRLLEMFGNLSDRSAHGISNRNALIESLGAGAETNS